MKKIVLGAALTIAIMVVGCSGGTDFRNQQISVEWADAVKWKDKKYYFDEELTNALTEGDIGEEMGEITFAVAGSAEESNPNYQLKNNEATYVGKGTKIFKMIGQADDDVIVVENMVYAAR
ncbi:hypothetical protein ACQ0QQ_04910 [Lysinibacillus sphaericus]